MLNQRSGLIFSFLVVFLLACLGGLLSVTLFIQNVVTGNGVNCSTRGLTSNTPSAPTVTVQEYFDALKNKDYNRACIYFDPKGIIYEGKKGQPVSAELLKSLDAEKRTLKSYSIVGMSVGTGNIVVIVVDVARSSQSQPYELYLSLQQEGGGWKIKSENGL